MMVMRVKDNGEETERPTVDFSTLFAFVAVRNEMYVTLETDTVDE